MIFSYVFLIVAIYHAILQVHKDYVPACRNIYDMHYVQALNM